jgi:hypothetical protein
MPAPPLQLKTLLSERRWQTYGTFCTEYDKAARRIDHDLPGTYPSRAQFYRWLTGTLRGLPYPDHCRVLEEMLPGWTADQLFQPAPPPRLGAHERAHLDAAQPDMSPPGFAGPPVDLRPFIEEAFTRDDVSIDFAGFSGETLHGIIQEPLDKIRTGRLKPETVTIRLLLPDTTKPMVLPCRADDLADDPDNRARLDRLVTRHAHAIGDTLDELASLGLTRQASVQIRAHGCPPLFKMYILNSDDMFFGLYPIIKHTITTPCGPHDIYDLMGKDSVVFHHSAINGQANRQYIQQAQAWFDSMWDNISYELPA